MGRLRHPVRSIKEPFGTAGLIVACIALVLALGGAAFAAAKLNSTQKKEVEKIAKKFAGKPGKDGAPGGPGPAGPAGPQGSQGSPGADGAPGAKGATGPAGKAGATGATGATGSIGAHLCPGCTETGRWSGFTVYPGGQILPIAISYPIPLEVASEKVVYLNPEETFEEKGTEGCELKPPEIFEEEPVGEPVAPPGTLCVFDLRPEGFGAGVVENIGETSFPGFGTNDSPAGALIWAKTSEPNGELIMHGVWAVTAPLAGP